jgi:DNA-directed RNA polymerase subunit RPC12/RpoP
MKYLCKNCNYRFEAKTKLGASSCPYCGEKKIVPEQSAEELLKEEE